MAQETLGLLLVREGIVTRDQLSDALRLQRQNGRLLGTCLLSMGYATAPKLLDVVSTQLGVPALPPGSLARASEQATALVPAALALRLRVVPYSWDGQILGVAVCDGRVLEHLGEIAVIAQAAVGAYVALEMEVEAALGRIYGHDQEALKEPPEPLPGRPRLARVHSELPDREFGEALGLEDTPVLLDAPVLLQQKKPVSAAPPPAAAATPPGLPPPLPRSPSGPKVASVPPPAAPRASQPPPPAVPAGPPPPASVSRPVTVPGQVLERLGLYDAVEQIYGANDVVAVSELLGRALLNYFSRILVMCWSSDGRRLQVVARAELSPERAQAALEALPEIVAIGARKMTYGPPNIDPRAGELGDVFGIEPGAVCLVAGAEGQARPQILALADNGANLEPYEDLHDVEMLFKEAETGLNILLARPIPIPSLK